MMNNLLQISLVLLLCIPTKNAVAQDMPVPNNSVLVVGVKHTPPFVVDNNGDPSGISVYLWDRATSQANIIFRYQWYDDIPSLLTALEEGEVDLTINPLTVTEERIRKMDFSQPYFISALGVAMRNESNWVIFLKNFFSLEFFQASAVLIGIVFLFGFLMWLVERKSNSDQFPRGIRGIGEGFWWSAVTMTTVGYGDRSPESAGGRVVAFVWMFAAIILISGITASITSALTINTLSKQISSIRNLSNIRTGTIPGSSSCAYLNANRIPTAEYKNIEQAIDALDKGEIDAVVYDKPILQYHIVEGGYTGKIQVLDKAFSEDYYAFGFSRGSNIDDMLNPIIIQEVNSSDWKLEKEKYLP